VLIHDRDDDVIPFAHSERLNLMHTRMLAAQDSATVTCCAMRRRLQRFAGNLDESQDETLLIREADLSDAGDAREVVDVLDSYASDPRGGGVPLTADVRLRRFRHCANTRRPWCCWHSSMAER
jgi:hypothetical protein